MFISRRRRQFGSGSFGIPAPLAPTITLVFWTSDPLQLGITTVNNTAGQDATYLEISLDGMTGWTPSITGTGSQTDFGVTGLDYNTVYYFRIRSQKNGLFSPYSNVMSFKTVTLYTYNYMIFGWSNLLGDAIEVQAADAFFTYATSSGDISELDSVYFITPAGEAYSLIDAIRLTNDSDNFGAAYDFVGYKFTESSYIDTRFNLQDSVHATGTSITMGFGVLAENLSLSFQAGFGGEADTGQQMAYACYQVQFTPGNFGLQAFAGTLADPSGSGFGDLPASTYSMVTTGIGGFFGDGVRNYCGINQTPFDNGTGSGGDFPTSHATLFLGDVCLDGMPQGFPIYGYENFFFSGSGFVNFQQMYFAFQTYNDVYGRA